MLFDRCKKINLIDVINKIPTLFPSSPKNTSLIDMFFPLVNELIMLSGVLLVPT